MKNIRIALLPSLLVLVLLVSGCTIPGLEWLFPGPSSEANDVVVIKSLQVTPAAQIEEGQSIHLYADVENIEEPGYPAAKNVQLVIYDYCQNLFDTPKANCPSGTSTLANEGVGCSLNDLKPKEIRTVDWTIKAKKIPVTQTCDIKLKVTYDFSTKGATRIVFIDPEELSARIRRGESWKVSASETLDYGPVKPYVTVMDQQPVPFSSLDQPAGATIKVQIKNVGGGYVSKIPYDGNNQGNVLKDTQDLEIKLSQESDPGSSSPQQTGCVFEKDGDKDEIELIQKQSSPLICRVTPSGGAAIGTEKTFHIQSQVSYTYEFRKEVKITVKPAKSAG